MHSSTSIILSALLIVSSAVFATNLEGGNSRLIKKAIGKGGHHPKGVGHHLSGQGHHLNIQTNAGNQQVESTVTVTVTGLPTLCAVSTTSTAAPVFSSVSTIASAATSTITAAPVVAPPLQPKNPVGGSIGLLESSIDAAASAKIIAAQKSLEAAALTAVGASASLAAVKAAEQSLSLITKSIGGAVSIAKASLSSSFSVASVSSVSVASVASVALVAAASAQATALKATPTVNRLIFDTTKSEAANPTITPIATLKPVVAPPLAPKNFAGGAIGLNDQEEDAIASARIIAAENALKLAGLTAIGASASLRAVAAAESSLSVITKSIGGAVSLRF